MSRNHDKIYQFNLFLFSFVIGITDNPHPYQFREAKTKKNNMKNDAFIVDLNADIIIRSK